MKFADLLFQKYASPFSLIDELISNGDFTEWINEFIDAENDRKIMDIWLHKVFDKSFAEFKQSILENDEAVSDEQIETTVSNSRAILNNFIPENRG